MGKKRIIKKTKEELLKETERVEAGMKKDVKPIKPSKTIEGRLYISSSYS